MKIKTAVQAYLDADRIREPKKKKESKFYISDMNKCMRMRWLKRKGIKAEFEPHVTWLFKIGDLYHEFVYRALESKGILLSKAILSLCFYILLGSRKKRKKHHLQKLSNHHIFGCRHHIKLLLVRSSLRLLHCMCLYSICLSLKSSLVEHHILH